MYWKAGLVALVVAGLSFLPLPYDIKPVPIPPFAPASTFDGIYSVNTKLATAAHRIGSGLQGPETVVFDDKNQLYGFTRDGWIINISPKGEGEKWIHVGGRPLSGQFDHAGNLYVCDAAKGLLVIAKGAHHATILAAQTTNDSLAFGFIDDLDIASDGKVYFSDATQISPARNREGLWTMFDASSLDYVEGSRTGRLIVWDPKTEVATTLLDGLFFANGVALGPNEKYVLVVETWISRVRRYWLKGPKAGTNDIFIEGLPGLPDGISRGSKSFWIAIPTPRPAILSLTDKSPFLRGLLTRLPDWLKPKEISYGLVVEVGFDGTPLGTLQDPTGEKVGFITAVTEHKGKLYLGSLKKDYVGVYEL